MTALARTTDPQTSHEAARGINARDSQWLVTMAFRTYGDGTDEEIVTRVELIADAMKMRSPTPQRIRCARKEIGARQAVDGSGNLKFSKTDRGGKCCVWTL